MLRKEEDVLMHYGVLGMRWGHRKDGGPQGYLGTYPKGMRKEYGLFDRAIKDDFSTDYDYYIGYAKNRSEFENHLYDYYSEHGISREMVDVNGIGESRSESRNSNCALCTTAAVANRFGFDCKAGESLAGTTRDEICSLYHGGEQRTFSDLKGDSFDDRIKDLESKSKPGDFGYIHVQYDSGGHSIYYTIDSEGKAFLADFQNPNRNANNRYSRSDGKIDSFFNVRDKIPDISKMEETGMILTDDFTDDYDIPGQDKLDVTEHRILSDIGKFKGNSNEDLFPTFLGAASADYENPTTHAVHILENLHEIPDTQRRMYFDDIMTDARTESGKKILYDYNDMNNLSLFENINEVRSHMKAINEATKKAKQTYGY